MKIASVRIVMWEGASLWLVNAESTEKIGDRRVDFHAHHAIQATCSLGGRFTLDTETARAESAVVVAADVRHAFHAQGLVALLFIEPESSIGRTIRHGLLKQGELAAIPPGRLADFPGRITAAYADKPDDDTTLALLGRNLATALGSGAAAPGADERVRKVIAWATDELDGPVSLRDAAEVGDLSASRFRHLFVEQTGLPFKTYVLWLRLSRALERYAAGASLTEAAHDAGFSDSPHLSRTFRRMFGVAPAELLMV